MMSAPKENLFESTGLAAQYEIILWYYHKKYYQQAVTLAREWIISKMCISFKKDPGSFKDREDLANVLGEWCQKFIGGHKVEGKTGDLNNQEIAGLWSTIIQVRNDMNHAGMRKNPKPSKSIIKQIDDFIPKLEKFLFNAD